MKKYLREHWFILLVLLLFVVVVEAQTPNQTTLIRTRTSDPSNCKIGSEIFGNSSTGVLRFCYANNLFGGMTRTIASGTLSLAVAAIASGACATTVTASAPGTVSTDRIDMTVQSDISGVTGYVPSTSGMLTIYPPWPTTDNVNIHVCNPTANSITPGATVTLNFGVYR